MQVIYVKKDNNHFNFIDGCMEINYNDFIFFYIFITNKIKNCDFFSNYFDKLECYSHKAHPNKGRFPIQFPEKGLILGYPYSSSNLSRFLPCTLDRNDDILEEFN